MTRTPSGRTPAELAGVLPKDIRAFAHRAGELGADGVATLLREVDRINLHTRDRMVELAAELCGGSVAGARVAVLGAAFKPHSDDVRDSPALAVATRLHELGAAVKVHDPEAALNARAVAPALTYAAGTRAALDGADVVLLLTEWPQFRSLDPVRAAEWVGHPRILDGRNVLDLDRWRLAGWTCRALGRPSVPAVPARRREPRPAPA